MCYFGCFAAQKVKIFKETNFECTPLFSLTLFQSFFAFILHIYSSCKRNLCQFPTRPLLLSTHTQWAHIEISTKLHYELSFSPVEIFRPFSSVLFLLFSHLLHCHMLCCRRCQPSRFTC